MYHGWKFDVTGQCTEIPTMARDEGLRSRVGLTAYPAREWGDLIWAYLGPPAHQPELPEMDFTLVAPSHRFVSKKLQECNWAQSCEGALDTAHFSFLHTPLTIPEVPAAHRGKVLANAMRWMKDDPRPVFHVLDHDAGLLLAASRHADDGDLYWRVTQFLMPNHSLAPGSGPGDSYVGQTWVPIDDRSCWVYVYTWNPERPLSEKESRFIPGTPSVHAEVDEHWKPIRNRGNDYLMDREAQRTRSFTGIQGISEQDAAIQDSQGFIVDRTREHLGPTDLGIVRFRRLVLDAAAALERGTEPAAAAATGRLPGPQRGDRRARRVPGHRRAHGALRQPDRARRRRPGLNRPAPARYGCPPVADPKAKTFDDTIGTLEAIVDRCAAAGDRAGYFAAMYLAVTNTMRERAAEGTFQDPARMERFITGFAGRYLDAVAAWQAGAPCTASWRVAFEASRRRRPIILQHLLLGMNAHINLDLGVAAVRRGRRRLDRRRAGRLRRRQRRPRRADRRLPGRPRRGVAVVPARRPCRRPRRRDADPLQPGARPPPGLVGRHQAEHAAPDPTGTRRSPPSTPPPPGWPTASSTPVSPPARCSSSCGHASGPSRPR